MESAFEHARRAQVARVRTWAIGMLVAIPLARGCWQAPPRIADVVTIDVQRAPAWQLTLLPGIGRMRSHQIVRLRRRVPIRGVADLAGIRGLGRRGVARIGTTGEVRIRWADPAAER